MGVFKAGLCASAWLLAVPALAQSSFYGPGKAALDNNIDTAVSAPPAPRDPNVVCEDLFHCAGIVERHAPDSFDYSVLAREFDRFDARAETLLLQQILGDDATQAGRALHVLARGRRLLSPAGQRQIVSLWRDIAAEKTTHNVDDAAAVLTRHLSPMVRDAAIDTLGSRNRDVRAASQIMLTRFAVAKMDRPLRPQNLKLLTASLRDDPHPGVVATVARDPRPAVLPILTSVLSRGDSASARLAYQALYARDKEDAFRALVATLYGLKDDNISGALALADVLRIRHKGRDDGFYMAFARDLATDAEMSVMGRLAGFDAVMQTADAPPLPANALTLDSYRRASAHYGQKGAVPTSYFDGVARMASKTPDPWLEALARAVRPDDMGGQVTLTEVAGRFDTDLSRAVTRKALGSDVDFRHLIAGLYGAAAQSTDDAMRRDVTARVRDLRHHPISAVAQAAMAVAPVLSRKTPRKALSKVTLPPLRRVNARTKMCAVRGDDFAAAAQPMPYFDGGILHSGRPALRGFLRTADRMRGGWLAGYSSSTDGALIAYQTRSGRARDIMPDTAPPAHHRVHAIVPFSPPALGQTADGYWVVVGTPDDAAIYRALYGGRQLDISLSVSLPSLPTAVRAGAVGEVIMAFDASQPPLSFSLDGGLSRHCDTVQKPPQDVLP